MTTLIVKGLGSIPGWGTKVIHRGMTKKATKQKTSITIYSVVNINLQGSANQKHDQQNEKATKRMGENTYRSDMIRG